VLAMPATVRQTTETQGEGPGPLLQRLRPSDEP
jgi:hypothetical protein